MLGNKKGISPLIATVLIIGFTIVAAVLVISWISSLIDETTDTQSCKAEALNECVRSAGYFEFTATANPLVDVKILNTGSTNASFVVIPLGSDGGIAGGCNSAKLTVPSFNSVSAGTSLGALTCTNASATSVRFVQEVTAKVGTEPCTETCGEGTVVTL